MLLSLLSPDTETKNERLLVLTGSSPFLCPRLTDSYNGGDDFQLQWHDEKDSTPGGRERMEAMGKGSDAIVKIGSRIVIRRASLIRIGTF